MATDTLFVWVVPAWFNENVVDHTWVTTYDNRKHVYASISDVIQANEDCWYCWGSYHSSGKTPGIPDGFLKSGNGSRAYSDCLCEANKDPENDKAAQGTIYEYGIDGVCHQLANQVLWSTGTAANGPLTVRHARGYWLSNFLFGTYGHQHHDWKEKKNQCMESTAMVTVTTNQDPDDFEAHVRDVLKGHVADTVVSDFINQRRQLLQQLASQRQLRKSLSADALNQEYSRFFKEAARLLGEANFERVFGVPPQDDLSIVDPRIYAASHKTP